MSESIQPDPAPWDPDPTPLCVDLDGSLISTDLLAESVLGLTKHHPLSIPAALAALRGGKAAFKAAIAGKTDLRVDLLPYREDVLAHLRAEKEAGRRIVLASASDRKYVEQVAKYLGLFDDVFASDGRTNLDGKRKADALAEKFGEGGFDYVGNAEVDLHVWKRCRNALAVGVEDSLAEKIRHCGCSKLEKRFSRHSEVGPALRSMRMHQWLKNLLVFVPLLLAHFSTGAAGWGTVLLAFGSFSLAASSVYILNDLLDLEADRLHARKKQRPFAAGRIDPMRGGMLSAGLLAGALALGTAAGLKFLGVLVGYMILTTAYSLWLKRIELVDVIVLALLYTVRILAGAAAAGAAVSFWLMAFGMFFFLSLAMVKRFTEMHDARMAGKTEAAGRSYRVDDLESLFALGSASGYTAILVCALYLNSADVVRLYESPGWLWAVCPLLLYWINRIWLLARRGKMHDDPVVFAAKDKTSLCIGLLILLAGWMAV